MISRYSRPGTARLAQFFRHVEPDTATGCWLWRGAINYKGYACYSGTSAFRFSYSWFVADIPEKYEIDHLCRVRACVNPAHLDAVTTLENHRRSLHWSNFGVCRRGHPMTADNTYLFMNKGVQMRACRICRMRSRRRWLSKVAAYEVMRTSRGSASE